MLLTLGWAQPVNWAQPRSGIVLKASNYPYKLLGDVQAVAPSIKPFGQSRAILRPGNGLGIPSGVGVGAGRGGGVGSFLPP